MEYSVEPRGLHARTHARTLCCRYRTVFRIPYHFAIPVGEFMTESGRSLSLSLSLSLLDGGSFVIATLVTHVDSDHFPAR
jgi:hypothetical protein